MMTKKTKKSRALPRSLSKTTSSRLMPHMMSRGRSMRMRGTLKGPTWRMETESASLLAAR